MIGLYQTMIDRLRQLSEPRLRQQPGIAKSQTPVERDTFVQFVRKPDVKLIYLNRPLAHTLIINGLVKSRSVIHLHLIIFFIDRNSVPTLLLQTIHPYLNNICKK